MPKTLLAIDYGTSKTGIAYSVGSIALSVGVFSSDTELLKKVAEIAHEKKAESIIVGVSRHMRGWISEHGERTIAWIKVLREVLPQTLPIIEWDERGTSASARTQFEEDFGYAEKKPLLDAEAARLILEDYLWK